MEFKTYLILILLIVLLYNIYPELLLSFLEKINDFVVSLLSSNDTEKNSTENMESVQQNLVNVNNNTNSSDPSNQMAMEINGVDDDLTIPYKYKNATYGDNYFIDDGDNGTVGLTSALCSKTCCKPQYPLPFDLPEDPLVPKDVEFVSSSYTCNNGFQDTGCLCMTKKQAKFLDTRGGNSKYRYEKVSQF